MNVIKSLVLVLIVGFFTSCGENAKKEKAAEGPRYITQQVDDAVQHLEKEITDFKKIVTLDHHRMAAEEGVYTPPSIATIFSNTHVNISLIQAKQLAALDVPYKVLCFAEPDTLDVKVAYTSADFISKRHDLDPELLKAYKKDMDKIITTFPEALISNTDVSQVEKDFGIVQLQSDFDYSTTVQKLRDIVMAQSDTRWFAEVDYQKDATALGLELRPTILLLFGGPAPGGKAMMTSPKIGLDAFCQKLLVFEKENGEVWVAYNDIVAFAELYYKNATKPQQMINQRLKMTFTKAISQPEKG